MAQRKLSTRESMILMVCLLLAAGYIGYNFVFQPMEEELTILDSKIRIAEKRLRDSRRTILKAPGITAEYENFENAFKQKESDSQVMAGILSEIESAASDMDLRLTDMKPQKVKELEFFNRFSVGLAVEGEFETIMRFLYSLQRDTLRFSIDELRLEKRSLRSSLIRCQLTLSRYLIP